MRNPWYTLAIGIIKRYKSCFIQNYTILLEALNQKTQGLFFVSVFVWFCRCSFVVWLFQAPATQSQARLKIKKDWNLKLVFAFSMSGKNSVLKCGGGVIIERIAAFSN